MNRRGFLAGLAVGLFVGAAGSLFSGSAGSLFSGSAGRRTRLLVKFSPREQQILALRARGWSRVQIANELWVSPFTVSVHEQNIIEKLQMHADIEAGIPRA